ncbi:MAG: cytidylyltransferase domain-containing protein, partial [Promethearchaeota archaeon]
MIDGKKIEALVPLRGGSKSIPRKNIKLIAGRPLCEWILTALLNVEEIDGINVSTEDDEIAQVAQAISPRIRIVKRPSELAADNASTESVMLHFAEEVEFDVLITAQATSPLTTNQDIKRGLDAFFTKGYDSLLTGVREKRFYWEKKGETFSPVNYDYQKRPRRQDFDGWLMENGAFYITSKPILLKEKSRLGGKIGVLEMAPKTSIEIDDPSDWHLVEVLLTEQKIGDLFEKGQRVKLLVVDVDGTLTDAGMYYSNEGEVLKKFNTRDAKGLELVRKEG